MVARMPPRPYGIAISDDDVILTVTFGLTMRMNNSYTCSAISSSLSCLLPSAYLQSK